MESKIIFGYKRNNTAGFAITIINVFDQPDYNVMCYPENPSKKPDGMPYIRMYTLEESVLQQIRDAIKENPAVFDIGKFNVEHPPVLDGVSNEFHFSTGDQKAEIFASNISAFQDKDILSLDGKEPVNARKVLKAFESIKTILVNNGINKGYLKLD